MICAVAGGRRAGGRVGWEGDALVAGHVGESNCCTAWAVIFSGEGGVRVSNLCLVVTRKEGDVGNDRKNTHGSHTRAI